MRAAVCGTFDVENFGDLLFPLIAQRRLGDVADLLFASPIGGPPVWGDALETVPVSEVLDGSRSVEGFVLGGGNIVHASPAGADRYAADPLLAVTAYPLLWWGTARVAAEKRLPVCWNAPGLPRQLGRRAAEGLAWAADAATYVSVRDAASFGHLRAAGVTAPVALVPDTAVEVSALWSSAELEAALDTAFASRGMSAAERLLALHLTARYATESPTRLAARVERMSAAAEAMPVLLATGPCHGDDALARAVAAELGVDHLLIDRPSGLREIVAVLAHCEAYVGSSLHGLITACAFGRHATAVVAPDSVGAAKVSGFLDQLAVPAASPGSWAEAEEALSSLLAAPAPWPPAMAQLTPVLDRHWATIRDALRQGRGAAPRVGRPLPQSALVPVDDAAVLLQFAAEAAGELGSAEQATERERLLEQELRGKDRDLQDAAAALQEAQRQSERSAVEADAQRAALQRLHLEITEGMVEADGVLRSTAWRLGYGVVRGFHRLRRRRSHSNPAEALAVRLRRLSTQATALSAPVPVAGTAPPVEGTDEYLDDAEARASLGESLLRATLLHRFTRLSSVRPLLTGSSLNDPLPLDARGALRPAAGARRADGPPAVDVIVPVHDALADVKRCLWSLLMKTTPPFHLILVNDGSDRQTTDFLVRFALEHPTVELIEHPEPPHGYTIAANIGMAASRGDYVVLLNSDTVLTSGWLERLIETGESDGRIGLIGPLSNAATHQSVPRKREAGEWAVNPLPPFVTEDGMAFLVDRLSERRFPRFPFLNGFCSVVKRAVLDAVGTFDEEAFGPGYCEENDYCVRTVKAGFELAVADHAYVGHAKSRSYGGNEGRRALARRHYEVFLAKHGEENIRPAVERLESDESLEPLRKRLAEATSAESRLASDFRRLCANPLTVAFLLPGLARGGSGGSHSVYQEARGLRALGVDAWVAVPRDAWARARETYDDAASLFVPFDGDADLAAKTADRDVVVATHHTSMSQLATIAAQRRDFLPAYYVQDYEPFFYDEGSPDAETAAASYSAMPGMCVFAKTQWMCSVLSAAHGVPAQKVRPSIDHDVFRPGELVEASPLRVVAMVRPRTPRRQPARTLRVMDLLARTLGDAVDVSIFGSPDEEVERLAPERSARVRNLGLLSRDEVADVLRASHVFVDLSIYQAFGRTALEAMACGCASVVPNLGGTAEFVVDGDNGLVVDTADEAAVVGAIAGLVQGPERVMTMRDAAIRTAGGYSVLGAALSEYVLFAAEHARLSGQS